MKKSLFLALIGLSLVSPRLRAQDAPPATREDVKARFLKLLDRPRVALDPRTKEVRADDPGGVSERVDFATEARADGTIERVPALVVRPRDAAAGVRRPAVIVLHGTGGNKQGMRPWLEDLARLGFVAVAIDGRYHGERDEGKARAEAYNAAIVRAWRSKPGEPQEHPLYFDTAWDVWRTIDYLQARPDVDPGRIGLMGISKGGIETWLAGAVDDRIKVAVPAIAVQGFRWGLDHDRWQARANTVRAAHEAVASDLGEPKINPKVCLALWSKVIPGVLDRFDGPSMVRLFAGRPLLILNGENDPNCPIQGAEVAFASAREAFHEAKADDHLRIMVAKGVGHTVTPDQREAALAWFTTWLRPTPPPSSIATVPTP